MRRYLFVSALFVAGVLPARVAAQSDNAVIGWITLVSTPVGAFAPSVFVAPSEGTERRWGAQARYGRWRFASDDDNTTNLGAGLGFPLGKGRLGVEVGRTTKRECPRCDAWMLGASLDLPLKTTESGLALTLNPELGFMRHSGDVELTALAGAVNLAVSFPVAAGPKAKLVPFVAPGVGIGRLSGTGGSDSGERLMIGGGVSILGLETGLQATVGASKILIDHGVTVFGVSIGLSR